MEDPQTAATTIFELTLTAIAHGGEALGRHAGKVVFVPYALPGERVRVRVVEEKDNWARAQLLEVLASSPDRVAAPCPYFGPDRCGGCQWQHIAYERQLALKREIVRDQLQRLGKLAAPPVEETWAVALEDQPDPAWHYRNHVQFRFTHDGLPGFARAGSRDIIPIERCLILQPALDALYAALWAGLAGRDIEEEDASPATAEQAGYKGKVWVLGDDDAPAEAASGLQQIDLRLGCRSGQTLLVFETADDRAPEFSLDLPAAVTLRQHSGDILTLVGASWLEEVVAGQRYRVSAGSFFQVNTAGAEALVDRVTAFLDPRPHHRLLDAYAGVGLFALTLAPLCAQVDAVEAEPAACRDFAYNARGLQNVTLHEGTGQAVLPALPGPYDGIVVDPPRRGLGEAVVAQLARLAAPRLVYVSCDPATLARDAVQLVAAGYHLRTVQPLDLFPQTYHVESVALWER